MKKYLFTDADASHGILYYRIKQTDFDGKYTYTKIIAVRKNNKKFFDLISAFVDRKFMLNLLFMNYSSNEAIVNLYDCAGNVVLLQRIKTLEGQNNIEMILPPIKNGIYFLSICDTEFNEKIYNKIVVN